MFGGAGVANATTVQRGGPVIDHDDVGRENNGPANDQDSDKTGLWGLVGLLGLLGLAGLKRRNDTNDAYFAASPAAPGKPEYPRR